MQYYRIVNNKRKNIWHASGGKGKYVHLPRYFILSKRRSSQSLAMKGNVGTIFDKKSDAVEMLVDYVRPYVRFLCITRFLYTRLTIGEVPFPVNLSYSPSPFLKVEKSCRDLAGYVIRFMGLCASTIAGV